VISLLHKEKEKEKEKAFCKVFFLLLLKKKKKKKKERTRGYKLVRPGPTRVKVSAFVFTFHAQEVLPNLRLAGRRPCL
jgi:hypothetical protein